MTVDVIYSYFTQQILSYEHPSRGLYLLYQRIIISDLLIDSLGKIILQKIYS